MKSVGFVLLWLVGSIAAVSLAFAGVAFVDDDLIDPAPARPLGTSSANALIRGSASGPPSGVVGNSSQPPDIMGAEAPLDEPNAQVVEGRVSAGDILADERSGSDSGEAVPSSSATVEPTIEPTTGPTRMPTTPEAPTRQPGRVPANAVPPTPAPTSVPPTSVPTQPLPAPTPAPATPVPSSPVQTQPPTAPPSTAVPTQPPTVPPTAVPAQPPTQVPAPPQPTAVRPTPAPTSVPPTPVPTPTSVPPTPTVEAAPQVRTFNLVGGSTAISFSPSSVEVLWASPEPGFEVDISPGSGTVRVEFESDDHESRIEAWWSDGPDYEVREEN